MHTSPPHPQIFKENLLKLTLARSIHVKSNMIAHLSIKCILPSNFFTLRFANDSSKVLERFPIYTHQPLDPQLQASDEYIFISLYVSYIAHYIISYQGCSKLQGSNQRGCIYHHSPICHLTIQHTESAIQDIIHILVLHFVCNSNNATWNQPSS